MSKLAEMDAHQLWSAVVEVLQAENDSFAHIVVNELLRRPGGVTNLALCAKALRMTCRNPSFSLKLIDRLDAIHVKDVLVASVIQDQAHKLSPKQLTDVLRTCAALVGVAPIPFQHALVRIVFGQRNELFDIFLSEIGPSFNFDFKLDEMFEWFVEENDPTNNQQHADAFRSFGKISFRLILEGWGTVHMKTSLKFPDKNLEKK